MSVLASGLNGSALHNSDRMEFHNGAHWKISTTLGSFGLRCSYPSPLRLAEAGLRESTA